MNAQATLFCVSIFVISGNLWGAETSLPAIKKQNKLYFREASMIKKKVSDTPLDEYLSNYLNSPSVKGINILQVNAS